MSECLNKSAERPQKMRPLLLFHVNVHSFSYLALPIYFPTSLWTGNINAEMWDTPDIPIIKYYANTKSLCKILAERRSSSHLQASDVKKVMLAYVF